MHRLQTFNTTSKVVLKVFFAGIPLERKRQLAQLDGIRQPGVKSYLDVAAVGDPAQPRVKSYLDGAAVGDPAQPRVKSYLDGAVGWDSAPKQGEISLRQPGVKSYLDGAAGQNGWGLS